MIPRAHYMWYGHASSEGGPVIVADVESYAAWGGAEEDWSEDAVYRVHWYGPLIARLPPRFQPSGAGQWHQYHCVKTVDAARAYVRELRAAAEQLEPALTMREQKRMSVAALLRKVRGASAAMQDWLDSWRDHIEGGADFHAGGQRVLHVDAKPDTDYARACEALAGEAALVRFGEVDRCEAVVWDLEGPGIADVALSQEGFLLMRSWVDAPEHEREARKHAVAGTEEASAGGITFASGRVVIAWAPVAPRDLVSDADVDLRAALRAAAELNPPVQLNQKGILGVGTAIRIAPGAYAVTTGAHKADGWSCRWARFTHRA